MMRITFLGDSLQEIRESIIDFLESSQPFRRAAPDTQSVSTPQTPQPQQTVQPAAPPAPAPVPEPVQAGTPATMDAVKALQKDLIARRKVTLVQLVDFYKKYNASAIQPPQAQDIPKLYADLKALDV